MDLARAIEIAVEIHKGCVDRYDQPYILHPLRVMTQMETIDEMIVAILHDVVEDSDMTFESLEEEGFEKDILDAIFAISKQTNEDYFVYIHRLAKNKLARKVKYADLNDNVFNSKRPCPESLKSRYFKALEIIQGYAIDDIVEEER